jgi:serine/threonine-protein kinase RsbW
VDRLRVPAVLDSMDDVVRYVRELARRAGLSSRRTGQLRLAAEELVTNIIMHGYRSGSTPDCAVELEGGVDGDRVWLRIVDDAPAFDPTRVPEPDDLRRPLTDRMPGGLGLYLARSCVDGMTYESVSGRNTVTLIIHCARPPSVSAHNRRGGECA